MDEILLALQLFLIWAAIVANIMQAIPVLILKESQIKEKRITIQIFGLLMFALKRITVKIGRLRMIDKEDYKPKSKNKFDEYVITKVVEDEKVIEEKKDDSDEIEEDEAGAST